MSYPTAWLIQQKLMQAMVERDDKYTLCGNVQADDAYLGGELTVAAQGRPGLLIQAASTGQSSRTVASLRICQNLRLFVAAATAGPRPAR